MKKFVSALITASILTTGMVYAEYENTGTINLDDLSVSGNGIAVEDNIIKITSGGDFTVTGTLADGMIYINTEEKVKLRLSGMSLTNPSGPAIFFDNADKALITVTDDTKNFLADGADYGETDAKAALFSNDDLEIKGKGTLDISASYKHGIASDDDLSFDNACLNITAASDGIHANNDITILGGTLNISAGSDGIQSESALIIDGGTINITESEEGLESGSTTTINGGDININSTDDGINSGGGTDNTSAAHTTDTKSEENTNADASSETAGNKVPQAADGKQQMRPGRGMRRNEMTEEEKSQLPERTEGERPQMPERTEDGEFTPFSGGRPGGFGGMGGGMGSQSTDDDTKSLYVNGGTIKITAGGDGIDSNGNIYLEGGEVYIYGPENNGNGFIDCYKLTINGGILAAAGSGGMAQNASSDSAQNSSLVRLSQSYEAGTVVSVKDSDGEELISFTPEKKYSAIQLSLSGLTKGETYEIFIDGTSVQTFEQTETSIVSGSQGGFGGRVPGGGFGGGRNNMRNSGGGKNSGSGRIKVKLNNNDIDFDTDPIIENDTTLVPVRAIFEALGMTVEWNNENSVITAIKDDIKLIFKIGSKTATKNSKNIELLTAPVLQNQRTLVPVRFIAESLGLEVNWNEESSTVEINENPV